MHFAHLRVTHIYLEFERWMHAGNRVGGFRMRVTFSMFRVENRDKPLFFFKEKKQGISHLIWAVAG